MTLAGHITAGPDFCSPVSLDIAQWVLVGLLPGQNRECPEATGRRGVIRVHRCKASQKPFPQHHSVKLHCGRLNESEAPGPQQDGLRK